MRDAQAYRAPIARKAAGAGGRKDVDARASVPHPAQGQASQQREEVRDGDSQGTRRASSPWLGTWTELMRVSLQALTLKQSCPRHKGEHPRHTS